MAIEMERPTGLTEDVGWEIGVSRTFRCDLDHAWQVLTGRPGVEVWLGDGAVLPHRSGATWDAGDGSGGEVRSFRPLDRVRLTHRAPRDQRTTTIQLALTEHHAEDGPRTVVRFHQERLTSGAEREAQRSHWRAVADALAAQLEAR